MDHNDKIYYSSYDDFLIDIEKMHRSISLQNKSNITIINDFKEYNSFSSGLYSINKGGIYFPLLYQKKDSRFLYVFLNAGGVKKEDSLPIFQRSNYFEYLDGDCINIADPMHSIYKEKEPLATWYYGDQDESYIYSVVEIVIEFAKIIGTEKENICFIGSSAGGYAALFCSSLVKGSTAITINPQIMISMSKYSNDFANKTKINLFSYDKYHRNDISNFIINESTSKYLIACNIRSKEDIDQLVYFCKRLNYRFYFGLQQLNSNIKLWLYDANNQPYHNAIEPSYLFPMIVKIAKSKSLNERFSSEELKLFNEIWHNEYEYKRRLKESIICSKQ